MVVDHIKTATSLDMGSNIDVDVASVSICHASMITLPKKCRITFPCRCIIFFFDVLSLPGHRVCLMLKLREFYWEGTLSRSFDGYQP